MKNKLTLQYLGALAIAFACSIAIPASASAATVYLQSSRTTMSVGDTAVITVKIDANAAVLNTVEGDIIFSSSTSAGSVVIQQFSLADSAFGLWPRTPSLSNDATDVSFVGGVPGGFSIEGATVFKIIVQAKNPGMITIAPSNVSVFANDGKGTKVASTLKNIVITVTPQKSGAAPVDDWASVVAKDTTPPQPFIVVLGQDPSIFSGKKFAFFSAVDNQSGVAYYDVSENGATPVRSGSAYVLADQTGNVKLTVTAYDKAGNKRIAMYPSSTENNINWVGIIIVVLVIVAFYFILKKIIARTKRNKQNASPAA
ncbi:MAG: hypothetical protein P4L61_04440 [Candidatus Pacebacteria bacterium]|nr:hypothetical protein [Candidatus Paceibacterota bacterium]